MSERIGTLGQISRCLAAVIFCLICLHFEASVGEKNTTLRMVHILYRHGDRGPISFYPKDPYKKKAAVYWPDGLGQLTKKGKAMEYQLGLWLRNRYKSFMSKVFKPEEINIISTNYDRTLMSAQCVLASFYYPDNETRFIDDLSWMPTPVHTSPKGSDQLLNVDAACPRMSKEMSKLQSIPEIISFYEHHEELFRELSESSGLNLTTALEVDYLFDTLKIEKIYNLTLPSWALNKYEDMKAVGDFSFKLNTFTHELKRLRGGPLVGLMVDNMHKKSHGKLPDRKMLMFSAHDTTVATLLNTMGVFNDLAPPYAATVLIELHQINDDYVVKGFYQNDSTMANPPHRLVLPGCNADCPLDQWTNLLADVNPKNWSRECYRPDPERDHRIIVGLAGLSTLLGSVMLVHYGRILYINYLSSASSSRRRGEGFEPLLQTVVVKPDYGTLDEGLGSIEWSSESSSLEGT